MTWHPRWRSCGARAAGRGYVAWVALVADPLHDCGPEQQATAKPGPKHSPCVTSDRGLRPTASVGGSGPVRPYRIIFTMIRRG
jgi:hypothetical protein